MLRPGGGSQKAVQSVLTASLVGGSPAVDSCGILGFGRLNDDLECSGPLSPASSIPASFIFKGHLVFCKDNAVSVSKHIVQQKLNKNEQATQIIEHFLQKNMFTIVHLDSKGQKASKKIGGVTRRGFRKPRYSHPTAGRQVNDYLRLQSALRIYAER